MIHGRHLYVILLLISLAGCHSQTIRNNPTLSGTTGKQIQNAPALFRDVAQETGLIFHHSTGATGAFYMPEVSCGGVALLDFDNDGDLDVLFIQGGRLDGDKSVAQLLAPFPKDQKSGCRLYRNDLKETGKLHFTDVTEKSGLDFKGYGCGVAVGDYDNDGLPDVYITGFEHNALYHNLGHGRFEDITAKSGTDPKAWSTSASWVDYDGDGKLDLAVANYLNYNVKENKKCYSATGEQDYCGPSSFTGVSARLYHNDGGGKFHDVSAESGIASLAAPGLGMVCADMNADGIIDIFIANDGKPNHLWLNTGKGKFVEKALQMGLALNQQGSTQANMGIALGDADGDGNDDLLITHIVGEGVVYYRNEGKYGYRDASQESGLLQPTLQTTGFGTDWLDYDNDGKLDLFITNGAVKREDGKSGASNLYLHHDQLFHNEGSGKFLDVSNIAGPDFAKLGIGRAAAFGDLNNDGNTDIVTVYADGEARLLLNQGVGGASGLDIKLVGVKCNRMGLGARVGVTTTDGLKQWRRCRTDGSYQSSSDPRVHFGLGSKNKLKSIEVIWPDGSHEVRSASSVSGSLTFQQGLGIVQ